MADGTQRKEDAVPGRCKRTRRLYLVHDPGGYDWDASRRGIYSTLQLAQKNARYDPDYEIESFILDCKCYHPDHEDRQEPREARESNG